MGQAGCPAGASLANGVIGFGYAALAMMVRHAAVALVVKGSRRYCRPAYSGDLQLAFEKNLAAFLMAELVVLARRVNPRERSAIDFHAFTQKVGD